MALVETIDWYRHRFASMSWREIAHRAREAARKKRDCYQTRRLVPDDYDFGVLPQIPGLRERLEAWNPGPQIMEEWDDLYRRSQAGQFFLLGRHWPECPPHRKWHFDPVAATFWPDSAYCFSINFRRAAKMGDVKYVWELNRLQYLQPIAALAFKKKDVNAAQFCLDEIESWIDNNLPHRGINWVSGIELALRAISILFVTTLVGEYLTEKKRARIWASLASHAYWLERYPSLFSSANNHLVAEGLGLFVVGALCAPLRHAERWRRQGWKILCEAAGQQILSDGVGAEQAISYSAVVLEMLMLGLHIARASHIPIPEDYIAQVCRGGEFLRWITDGGGNQPRIGDDDNARIIGCYKYDEYYTRSILASIAAVTERPDLVPPHAFPHLRDIVFGTPPLAEDGPKGVRTFEQGGYTVARHLYQGQQILLMMDHGPLGYLSIAAHGHADALAVWLHIADQPVLVDSGTYLYHSGGVWRNYFRGTAAHNTLLIQNADQSSMAGNFNWSRKANASLTASEFREENWWIEGGHDGYRDLFGAIHTRRIRMVDPSAFSIEDRISCTEDRQVEIGFLIHPSLTVEKKNNSIKISKSGKFLLGIHHAGPLEMRIDQPNSETCGWYSPTFGEKVATARIVFFGSLRSGKIAITNVSFADAES